VKRPLLLMLAIAVLPACETPVAQPEVVVKAGNQVKAENNLPSTRTDRNTESGDFRQLCRINAKSVKESSGIAVTDPEIKSFWTHNDSGDNSELYLISSSTGELVSTVELEGAKNNDWEDMSHFESDGRQWLMVADVGDNGLKRKDCKLYLFELSALGTQTKQTIEKKDVHELEFEYEDGPHDCEAVAVTRDGEAVLLVEKRFNPFESGSAGVYQIDLPAKLKDTGKLLAKRIAGISAWAITGMDIAPDRQSLIIRSYLGAQLYRKQNPQQTWQEVLALDKPKLVQLPAQQQGEAICYAPDGQSVLITSEGTDTIVWQVTLPKR